jgi:hypothetical protein
MIYLLEEIPMKFLDLSKLFNTLIKTEKFAQPTGKKEIKV